eukprot:CAMPEP_0197850412 /NCGR_PEP_ID=MMETSP1438-20131217/15300_1 /TAXON_ID=1461541 /ORGANISM="Pterosperma sp., Strain CCMP1384" /LENGTH=637 /DNA_ID=CAMNT_0043463565 /DNA_START=169 /DNA_END=2079 /DNA_ORIENTATION=-
MNRVTSQLVAPKTLTGALLQPRSQIFPQRVHSSHHGSLTTSRSFKYGSKDQSARPAALKLRAKRCKGLRRNLNVSAVSTEGKPDTASENSSAAAIPGDHMAGAEIGKLPPGVDSATFHNFQLASGQIIDHLVIAYSTYGDLNENGDNGVIVGHSLTSNSNVDEWWQPMMGDNSASETQYALDTSSDFIICCNYCGSPYGSSSPVISKDPSNENAVVHGGDFPVFTMQDQVRAQKLLLDLLGVKRLKMSIGGSMGGMLALEWSIMYPEFVDRLVIIAACGRHTDWAIGIGEAQRNAIIADRNFKGGTYLAGEEPDAGLAAARMMAMLSYRAPSSVDAKFGRATVGNDGDATQAPEATEDGNLGETQEQGSFAVETYLQYQGEKFIQRFDANCYIALTKTLDSHDVSIGRGDYEEVLASVKMPTLVVGIDSDMLYPLSLQEELVRFMPQSVLHTIYSPHGHDSFLIEIDQLNDCVARFRGDMPTSAAAEQARQMMSEASEAGECDVHMLEANLASALQRADHSENEVRRLYKQLQQLQNKLQAMKAERSTASEKQLPVANEKQDPVTSSNTAQQRNNAVQLPWGVFKSAVGEPVREMKPLPANPPPNMCDTLEKEDLSDYVFYGTVAEDKQSTKGGGGW